MTATSTVVALTRRTAVVEVDNDGRPCGRAQGTAPIADPAQDVDRPVATASNPDGHVARFARASQHRVGQSGSALGRNSNQ